MRKIFIDLGAHKGDTVKAFKGMDEYSPDFELFAFEPNPNSKIHKKAEKYGVTVFQKAAWIEDGVMPFYTNPKHLDCQGGTLLKEKTSGGLDKNHPLMVETVDIGKWIKDNFASTDTIILKMDIEGAEYKVLSKMVDDGSIAYIDKLYIETHYNRIGFTEGADKALFAMLAKISTLTVCDEFAHLTYKKEA